MLRKILAALRAAVRREAEFRKFVLLLNSDDATLGALGVRRADVRLAFLKSQRPYEGQQGGPRNLGADVRRNTL